VRLLIIRHGDPDYENDTLTEKGHKEAQLLAQKLGKEKIDYLYSSPLGRAKHTCDYVAKALGKENDIVIKDWLKEFCSPKEITLSSGRKRWIPWDMLPAEWQNEPKMRAENWYEQEFYRAAETDLEYKRVAKGLDELLASHGYVRDGYMYRTKKGHTDTIALFCHFGLETVLLSHLFGISPIPLWHHFCALPTSVTTLFTEERREGEAVFRCCGFGDVGHLYAGGEEPSFAARFCETFDSKERHD